MLLAVPFACGAGAHAQGWTVQTSEVRSSLRGVSAVHASASSASPVIWASGSGSTVLRSDDGGTTWKQLHVEGGEGLDFRAVYAMDGKTAYVMSIGGTGKSRIYKTTDAGQSWELQYSDPRPRFFLDALVCQNEAHCFAISDPIDSKFVLIATTDGKNWKELPRDNMPPILPGEGTFAASGTALALFGSNMIYFATGGSPAARVFRSPDLGRTWTVSTAPLVTGTSSMGAFSILPMKNRIVVVGGDYTAVAKTTAVAAFSTDDGKTWQLASQMPSGFRSAVASLDASTLVAVGPNGEDVSHDGGATWTNTGTLNLNAVAVLDGVAWGVGARGTIARFSAH